jgi:ElaB/YqjD/DUF883 family membrane-anchored ribosome-binding protein
MEKSRSILFSKSIKLRSGAAPVTVKPPARKLEPKHMSISEQDIKEGRLNDELASSVEGISARVEAGVEKGLNAWSDFKADATDRCRAMASSTNEYVQDRPWQAIGIAAGLGLILGLLCSRR